MIRDHKIKQCPVYNTFRIIGKKFTLLIIRDMMYKGQTRFNHLLNSVEGINPKSLSIRLREMEKEGLIKRQIHHDVPVRIEYVLTEKGQGLKPLLEQMAEYSMTFYPKDVFTNSRPCD